MSSCVLIYYIVLKLKSHTLYLRAYGNIYIHTQFNNCYEEDYIENKETEPQHLFFLIVFFFTFQNLIGSHVSVKGFAYSTLSFKSKPCHVFTSALGGPILL